MTTIEAPRHNGATPHATGRSTEDRAREVWRPGMKGTELGRLLGVPERTGRHWAGILRQELEAGGGDSPASPPARPATPAPAKKPRPATGRGKQPSAPPLLVAVTGVAVAVVVTVAAVVSYSHIRALAIAAGMGGLAGWMPLALDGLVVVCSTSLIVDRQNGKRTSPLAAGGLVIGLAASLAANVLAVDPTLASERAVAVVLAGYSPIALAVSGHLLLRMLGER